MAGVGITIDIDWAPDFVIDAVADLLIERGVRATWFVTHASPAVERLRTFAGQFELGIHPNFMAGSSHGSTPLEVLTTCLKLVPDAVSMRTHGVLQWGSLFDLVMSETSISCDLTMFMPQVRWVESYGYYRFGRRLTRVPYIWEDDYAMGEGIPPGPGSGFVGLKEFAESVNAIAIFNFHPIHVYLNSASMSPYEGVKKSVPNLRGAVPGQVDPYVAQNAVGARNAFIEIADHLAYAGGGILARDLI